MKIKTQDLAGVALDWAVAAIVCPNDTMIKERIDLDLVADTYQFTTDWAQGGPLSERFNVAVHPHGTKKSRKWVATIDYANSRVVVGGETELIAKMRCIVMDRLGDEVDVPEELCT